MTKSKTSCLDNKIELLLNDVMFFLESEIKNEKMTLESRLAAKILIEKCKLYLDENVQGMDMYNNTPYVDMQVKTTNVLDEYIESDTKFKEAQTQEALYQNPSLNLSKSDNLSTSTAMNEESKYCPYANLPAQQVNTCEKNGPLIKKSKFLFFEHHKNVFAAVQETFFLIYLTEKDVKPFRTIELTNYDVRVRNNGKCNKKKSAVLELVSSNNKTYQFIAPSEEEANEWCIAISKKMTKNVENNFKPATVVHRRNLPPLPNLINNTLEANTYEIVDIDVDYSEIESNEEANTEELEEKKGKEVLIPLPPRVPEGVSFKSPLNSTKKTNKRQHLEKRSHKQLFNNCDSVYFRDNEQINALEWKRQRNELAESGTYDTIENENGDNRDSNFEKGEENASNEINKECPNDNSKDVIKSSKSTFTLRRKTISDPHKKKSYHVSFHEIDRNEEYV